MLGATRPRDRLLAMKILVTAGPTREPIDAVRYIANRSSGKMGVAIARAAVAAGHDTTLLLGPVAQAPLDVLSAAGVHIERFESCAQLQRLIEAHWPSHDMLIMAAAVADYRPVRSASTGTKKLPRQSGQCLTLTLEATPDLVAAAAAAKRPDQRVIAFALEQADQLETRAIDKLRRKGADAIVANPLDSMGADTVTAVWLAASGDREALGPMGKDQFAVWLIAKVS
jgi:phosphopantothenoylcysteine decarboxylase/phosphopantothenate--cysteine ligase